MKREYTNDIEKELLYKEVDRFTDEVKTATTLKREEVDELINLVKDVYKGGEEDEEENK